jgi:hypothetical protein
MMCGKPLSSSGSIGLPRVAASDKLKILTSNQHDVWSFVFPKNFGFHGKQKDEFAYPIPHADTDRRKIACCLTS